MAEDVKLPELPSPVRMSSDQAYMGFTSDQMRAYAEQAIDALRAEVENAYAAMNAALGKVIEHRDARQRAEAQAAELREALEAAEKALRVAAHALAHASEGNNVYTSAYVTVDAALSRAADDTQAGERGEEG